MTGLPADLLEAMLQSLDGGEFHLRPTLGEGEDAGALATYLEIGLALRRCVVDPSRHDELLRRLSPHRDVIIGALPAGLQRHGLLPEPGAQPRGRELDEIGEPELRQWLIDDGRLIYGELKREELDRYLEAIGPLLPRGGTLIDLGSGLGKVVMTAALKLPLARSVGVELLGYRHRMAQERLETMLGVGARHAAGGAAALPGLRERIILIEQDMFEADVSQASLVFIYSTCFAPLMDALADKLARELPEGALVSTTTYALNHPAFRLVRQFPSQTLAWTSVFLYQRCGALEGLPAARPSYLYTPGEADWLDQARQALERLAAG